LATRERSKKSTTELIKISPKTQKKRYRKLIKERRKRLAKMSGTVEQEQTNQLLRPLNKLVFKGKHITEFLKRYELEAQQRNATDLQKVQGFPTFCKLDPYVLEQIMDLPSYAARNWTTFKEDLLNLFQDETEDRYTEEDLVNLVRKVQSKGKPTSYGKIIEFHRKFALMSGWLKKKKRISAEEETKLFMNGLPSMIKADLGILRRIKKGTEDDDDGDLIPPLANVMKDIRELLKDEHIYGRTSARLRRERTGWKKNEKLDSSDEDSESSDREESESDDDFETEKTHRRLKDWKEEWKEIMDKKKSNATKKDMKKEEEAKENAKELSKFDLLVDRLESREVRKLDVDRLAEQLGDLRISVAKLRGNQPRDDFGGRSRDFDRYPRPNDYTRTYNNRDYGRSFNTRYDSNPRMDRRDGLSPFERDGLARFERAREASKEFNRNYIDVSSVRCIYCKEFGHTKFSCGHLTQDIREGLCVLDKQNRVLMPDGTYPSPNSPEGMMGQVRKEARDMDYKKEKKVGTHRVAFEEMPTFGSRFGARVRFTGIEGEEEVDEDEGVYWVNDVKSNFGRPTGFRKVVDFDPRTTDRDVEMKDAPVQPRIYQRNDRAQSPIPARNDKPTQDKTNFPKYAAPIESRISSNRLMETIYKTPVTVPLGDFLATSNVARDMIAKDVRRQKVEEEEPKVRVSNVEAGDGELNDAHAGGLIFVSGQIDNFRMRMLLDSGSEINLISKQLANDLRLPIINQENQPHSMVGAGKQSAKLLGRCDEVPIRIGGMVIPVTCFVAEKSSMAMLLGQPFLKKAQVKLEYGPEGGIKVKFAYDGREASMELPARSNNWMTFNTNFVRRSLKPKAWNIEFDCDRREWEERFEMEEN
jgi:hypothetical protein